MTDALSLNLSRPVGPYGTAWHGLVKGGVLTLPNAATMPYPQPAPAGDPWLRGSTALLAHPDAPGVTRTPEEAAADEAAGREWWTQAILAGGNLYGQPLGGWIYIDPAGERWLVRINLHEIPTIGGTATVTLSRYGAFGRPALVHTYSVDVPNMGQSTPAISGTSGTFVTLYHSHPTGAAAVYEVSVQFNQVHRQFWRRRPVGWLEVTLAGLGAECEIAVTVLKTREQTLGTPVRSWFDLAEDNYYRASNPDGTSSITQTQPVGIDWTLLVRHNIVSGTEEYGFTGYVVGMFYDATGVRHEVTLDELAVTEYSLSAPVVHTGPTEFGAGVPVTGTWDCEEAWSSTWTLTVNVDAVPVASYAISISETSSEQYAINGNDPTTLTYAYRSDYTPGSYIEDSGVVTDPGSNVLGSQHAVSLFAADTQAGVATNLGASGALYPWAYTPNTLRLLQVCPYRYANQLFGLCRWERPQAVGDTLQRYVYHPDVATPTGAVTLDELVREISSTSGTFTEFAYASRCPVTAQLARELEPVCWV
ncbi:hypothetical protein [Pseudomonas indica]|uniref:Uncharacterized protein n=1 Tax=Pseudomonas indica TaxID=137658 RepID=A0A1G8V638_9PSED|nr:hypothetical protein [Pseudomonas indica]SDJ61552.1 hypothetical protein SAMN05216186_102112 [Pseudomonas indica]